MWTGLSVAKFSRRLYAVGGFEKRSDQGVRINLDDPIGLFDVIANDLESTVCDLAPSTTTKWQRSYSSRNS